MSLLGKDKVFLATFAYSFSFQINDEKAVFQRIFKDAFKETIERKV